MCGSLWEKHFFIRLIYRSRTKDYMFFFSILVKKIHRSIIKAKFLRKLLFTYMQGLKHTCKIRKYPLPISCRWFFKFLGSQLPMTCSISWNSQLLSLLTISSSTFLPLPSKHPKSNYFFCKSCSKIIEASLLWRINTLLT